MRREGSLHGLSDCPHSEEDSIFPDTLLDVLLELSGDEDRDSLSDLWSDAENEAAEPDYTSGGEHLDPGFYEGDAAALARDGVGDGVRVAVRID